MIFYVKDNFENVRQKAAGGEGEIRGLHPFKPEDRPQNTHFKMIGEMTLAAGASIGFHIHEKDEEVYMIVKGRGLYTDNDKKTYPVVPGDVTVTRQGEGHGLANTGDEPLVFSAVIAD
jgi:mannose-6-phosphate isomerase-like protein (cupin superfamily)